MIATLLDRFRSSSLARNSTWGIASSLLQNVFLSLFFILLARHYSTEAFANYLIANALYQLLAIFSTMGLSQWFIRTVMDTTERQAVIERFFKSQLMFGAFFYGLNIALAFLLYDDRAIHLLSIVFGFNIILDNLIYAIKSLNISEQKQSKTFKIMLVDSFLLLLAASVLLIHPFSILLLTAIQVLVRIITINLFLRVGSSDLLSLPRVLKFQLRFHHISQLIRENWTFVVIGSLSILFWRSAQVIVSLVLGLKEVAIYGIAYKLFQLAIIVPYIISTTVFPAFVRKFNNGDMVELRDYYQRLFLLYAGYGFLAFTFIETFAEILMPWIFGPTYVEAGHYTKLMFVTILVFPTAILQANLLVAMKMERMDMIFNLICLVLYLLISLAGLYTLGSLDVIMVAIFVSFLTFHILQDILLFRRELGGGRWAFAFYSLIAAGVGAYFLIARLLNNYLSFAILWILIGAGLIWMYLSRQIKDPSE